MPWQTKLKEAAGILPIRKIVKRAERGEWDEGVSVDHIPRQSAVRVLFHLKKFFVGGYTLFPRSGTDGVILAMEACKSSTAYVVFFLVVDFGCG